MIGVFHNCDVLMRFSKRFPDGSWAVFRVVSCLDFIVYAIIRTHFLKIPHIFREFFFKHVLDIFVYT